MPSVVEDFESIARRAKEIRAARYQVLGVSPASPAPAAPPEAPAPTPGGGFRYAPGFEHLATDASPTDEWDCCFPA